MDVVWMLHVTWIYPDHRNHRPNVLNIKAQKFDILKLYDLSSDHDQIQLLSCPWTAMKKITNRKNYEVGLHNTTTNPNPKLQIYINWEKQRTN